MSAPRTRARVFGEVAELYERRRPGYPSALYDDVLALADHPRRALEAGGGTGKATVELARRGLEVVSLEPDPAMAALARRATRGLPVQIKETAFEEWRGEAGSFDLVFSAQAWHWIDGDRGHAVARHALRPGGFVALWWNDLDDWEPPVRAALDAAYQHHAPELPDPVSTGAFQAQALKSLARHGFEPMEPRTYRWTHPYDAVSFSELLRTNSDHRLLPPERLDALLLAVAEVIEDVGGGEIICGYRTDLLTARRTGSPREEPSG